MRKSKLAITALCLLFPFATQAAIIMTITDDGTDLTMTASGTYDNTGLTSVGSTRLGVSAIVGRTVCCYGWETGAGNSTNYAANYSGSLTATSSDLSAQIISTSNPFWFWRNSGRITFQSSAPLIGSVNESATFLGTTLASLGMLAGESIQVTWGDNLATIQTSAQTSVPEPGSLALLGLGLAALGLRRRQQR